MTYAILSHTWRPEEDGGEQTFAQMRKLWRRMRKARVEFKGELPSKFSLEYDSVPLRLVH